MKSIAVTYAHSLFSLAEEENKEQEIFEELTELEGIFAENPEYTGGNKIDILNVNLRSSNYNMYRKTSDE